MNNYSLDKTMFIFKMTWQWLSSDLAIHKWQENCTTGLMLTSWYLGKYQRHLNIKSGEITINIWEDGKFEIWDLKDFISSKN